MNLKNTNLKKNFESTRLTDLTLNMGYKIEITTQNANHDTECKPRQIM
jgi:hypothetical protein